MPAIWIIRLDRVDHAPTAQQFSEHRHPRHYLVLIQRAFLLRLAARLRRSVLLDLDVSLPPSSIAARRKVSSACRTSFWRFHNAA